MKARTGAGGRGGLLVVMLACFLGGAAMGWWLHQNGPPLPPAVTRPTKEAARIEPVPANAIPSSHHLPGATIAAGTAAAPGAPGTTATLNPSPPDTNVADAIQELRRRALRAPIDGVDVESLKGTFAERRDGTRPHEAIDILAPRHTPIHAVEGGSIVKLFLSKAGGNTIYQFDPSGRFAYYYAHLERYADGISEGRQVKRGDVIAYVGTSGNAAPDAPHLHFTIFILTPERQWWKGTAVDPYLVLRP